MDYIQHLPSKMSKKNIFDFVTEDEEGENKDSVESIEDIDIEYPLADEPVYETALCAMKFPNSMKFLFDPDVWIADTLRQLVQLQMQVL
jgi:hypothetical protein